MSYSGFFFSLFIVNKSIFLWFFYQWSPRRQQSSSGLNPLGNITTAFRCCDTWACTSQGKYEEAEPLYRGAMGIAEVTLGKDHPQYSIMLNNLAGLLRTQVRASVYPCTLDAHLPGTCVLPRCCSIWTVLKKVSGTGVPSSSQSLYLSG